MIVIREEIYILDILETGEWLFEFFGLPDKDAKSTIPGIKSINNYIERSKSHGTYVWYVYENYAYEIMCMKLYV